MDGKKRNPSESQCDISSHRQGWKYENKNKDDNRKKKRKLKSNNDKTEQ